MLSPFIHQSLSGHLGKDKMVQLLSKAPRRHGAIRVTFVTAFFWARSDLAMDVIDEVIDADGDGHWKNAKLGFITQIGAWYYYCSKLKFSYCPRRLWYIIVFDIVRCFSFMFFSLFRLKKSTAIGFDSLFRRKIQF